MHILCLPRAPVRGPQLSNILFIHILRFRPSFVDSSKKIMSNDADCSILPAHPHSKGAGAEAA